VSAPPIPSAPADLELIAQLKSKLQFAELRIRVLEERLRLMRIEKYGAGGEMRKLVGAVGIESTPFTEGISDLLSGEAEGVAPGIWPLEIANALLVAERRKRISVAQVTALLSRIVQLPVWVETIEPDRAFSRVLSVARQH
jgi:hypothetical protein